MLPKDAWGFTLGEAGVMLEGARVKDEMAWLRTGQMISMLIRPHQKKGSKPLTAQDFNPYAKKKTAAKDLLGRLDEVRALLKSDRVEKLNKIHKQFQDKQNKDGKK